MIDYSEPYQFSEDDPMWVIDEIDEQGIVGASFAYPTEAAARSARAQLVEMANK